MAVQQELWLKTVQKTLHQGFELMRMVARDDSEFTSGVKVHVPNAGSPRPIVRGPVTLPLTVATRDDVDIDYDLMPFKVPPTVITDNDAQTITYDKYADVVQQQIGSLNESMRDYICSQWWTYNANTIVSTTGSSTKTNWLGGTAGGSLKYLIGDDVLNAGEILSSQKFPREGRYLLLPYAMFYQLLADLKYNAARLEVVQGLTTTVDKIYDFTVVQMPFVMALSTNTGTSAPIVPAAADGSFTFTTNNRPAGLAFHKSAVSYAWTPPKMYAKDNDPTYYGSILSAEVHGGGKYSRPNAEGVVAIRATSA